MYSGSEDSSRPLRHRAMAYPRTTLTLTVLLAALAGTAGAQELPPALDRPVDYDKEVQPLLQKRCLGCHGEKKQKGKLRLDLLSNLLSGGESGEPALVRGNSSESHLVKLVAGLDPELVMPPRGKRLSAGEIGLLRAWIDQGAKMPEQEEKTEAVKLDHWAFKPLTSIAPEKKDGAWGKNPVDRFIHSRLKERGIGPSPRADRSSLIRRLRLVMHGLPPTPEEIEAFVSDKRPDAWKRLVEEALESNHYGERWARHWLDIIRFGETTGFETNRPRPNAWHYRDYVIRSFNEDKPYDEFVREQIAGDALGNGLATGFLVAGPHDIVKSPDINLTLMQRQDELADLINVTGTTFLGLTLGCARCHNHKFDPVSQRDYYSIQATFAGVQHAERLIKTERKDPSSVDLEISRLKAELGKSIQSTSDKLLMLSDSETLDELGRGTTHLVPSGNPSVGGLYTRWENQPGKDFAAWQPLLKGAYRIWISWGAGSASHCGNAQYLIDRDGNPETRDDQELVATVDQRKLSGSGDDIPKKELWSGLLDAGIHQLEPASAVLLRGGSLGAAITAGRVIFQLPGQNGDSDPLPTIGPAVNARRNIDTFEPVEARFIRFTIEATNRSEPCIDELEVFSGDRNLALASLGARSRASSSLPGYAIHKLEHINDGKYGNSRSWISNETGKGWVQLELPSPALIDRVEWGRDREGRFSDRVAIGYRIEVGVDVSDLQLVASSGVRAGSEALKIPSPRFSFHKKSGKKVVASLKQAVASRRQLAAGKSVKAYVGTFAQPGPTYRLYRGDPLQKREEMQPGAVEVLSGFQMPKNAPEQQRRLAFARWLSARKNPLTARVIVNRIWMHHFGAGIVTTPNDFGRNGARPSHPLLLDWLATELMENSWSLKHIHRLLLLSSTFQQDNRPRKDGLKLDSASALLWRFPPRRMEAEAIRDSLLKASGALDLTMGGPGFNGFKVVPENVNHFFPKEKYGPEDYRRMIYMIKVRQEHESVFGAFDCPDASQVISKRSRSTTPIQALNLFNSAFVLQVAELLQKRLEQEAGPENTDRIRLAFELCFGRKPEPGEAKESQSLVSEHGLQALCRALFNSNEFVFIP